jgi:SPP1 gp7 family putative phage head morphogenesis protein
MSEAANLYADALAWAKAQKIVLPDEYYGAIGAASRNRSFSVAGLAQLDALQAVHKSLIDALASGKTQREWAKALLADPTAAQMLAMPAHRLDNIFRTNLQTGYMRGIARQQESPASIKRRPFFQYDAINDSRTRPSHMAMDNFIAPADDGIWKIWTPPSGYRCRCIRVALTQAEARARGWNGSTQPVPSNPDDGWGHHPLDGDADFLESIKAERLKQAHPAIVKAIQNQYPWRDKQKGVMEKMWHDASFIESPDWIKAAVGNRKALKQITNKEDGAWYSAYGDYINMPPSDDMGSLFGQAVWRHEFGHALDHSFSDGRKKYRSSQADFRAAMAADAKELIENAAATPKSYKITKAKEVELKEAYEKAGKEFIDADNRLEWLIRRYAAQGIDFAQFKSAMERHTDFATVLQGIGLQKRYVNLIVAIEKKDGQSLLDYMTGGKKTAESQLTFKKGNIGNLSDLLGSATLNKVAGMKSGFGHVDSYYKGKLHDGRSETESFANLTALYGDANPVFGQIVEIFTPRMAKLFKEIVNGMD